MGNSKDTVSVKEGKVTIDLDLRKIVCGFAFLAFPLANPEYIGDFKQQQKDQNLHQSVSACFWL